ncbi:MAG: Kae1-associated serine/threonine protein kinase [Candidatus Bathyarchaeota archaeon]|nr:MAG: Kae1-associated serine/threonine protein kinase [Candidatus Bathyarchaeota archaeon]
MEYIEGLRLKEKLNDLLSYERKTICIALGRLIGRLHQKRIIHGDLTKSNIIIDKNGKIFLVDFGLAEYSGELEKRGVDLLLAKRALHSTHYNYAQQCFNAIIEGYSIEMGAKATQKVIERIKIIEKRGRYTVER